MTLSLSQQILKADLSGRYLDFGGFFIPEILVPALQDVQKTWDRCRDSIPFQQNFQNLLKDFAGRPTALTEISHFAQTVNNQFQKKLKIFIKREDLLHTGAHKINNALGQCLLAKELNKTRIIAETGAGQHGVATAAACAYLGLTCEVYMGVKDMARQAPNVARMQLFGANVIPVAQGSQTLKEAVNEALRDWSTSFDTTHYCLGSVLGPHPFPEMVSYFHQVIGQEARQQCLEKTHTFPDRVVACVGGGSNALGIFSGFIDNPHTQLIGVEGGGTTLGDHKHHAAAFAVKKLGILHGCLTYLIQNQEGQILETHSIAAGLNYPAVGPQHAALDQMQRAQYTHVSDEEALAALKLLAKTEGILCALESAHALAYILKEAIHFEDHEIIVINLSGRGDKDLDQIKNLI